MEKVNKEREETKRHKNELEQRISEVIWPNKLYLESDKLRIHEASRKTLHKNGRFIVHVGLVELICLSSSKIIQVKASVKTQGGEGEDPDSRMDSERADRRDKKGGKGKVHQYFLVTFLYASDDKSRSFVFALSAND